MMMITMLRWTLIIDIGLTEGTPSNLDQLKHPLAQLIATKSSRAGASSTFIARLCCFARCKETSRMFGYQGAETHKDRDVKQTKIMRSLLPTNYCFSLLRSFVKHVSASYYSSVQSINDVLGILNYNNNL